MAKILITFASFFYFIIPPAIGQPEVSPWSNISGIRVDVFREAVNLEPV